jgi:hypothetical protein
VLVTERERSCERGRCALATRCLRQLVIAEPAIADDGLVALTGRPNAQAGLLLRGTARPRRRRHGAKPVPRLTAGGAVPRGRGGKSVAEKVRRIEATLSAVRMWRAELGRRRGTIDAAQTAPVTGKRGAACAAVCAAPTTQPGIEAAVGRWARAGSPGRIARGALSVVAVATRTRAAATPADAT